MNFCTYPQFLFSEWNPFANWPWWCFDESEKMLARMLENAPRNVWIYNWSSQKIRFDHANLELDIIYFEWVRGKCFHMRPCIRAYVYFKSHWHIVFHVKCSNLIKIVIKRIHKNPHFFQCGMEFPFSSIFSSISNVLCMEYLQRQFQRRNDVKQTTVDSKVIMPQLVCTNFQSSWLFYCYRYLLRLLLFFLYFFVYSFAHLFIYLLCGLAFSDNNCYAFAMRALYHTLVFCLPFFLFCFFGLYSLENAESFTWIRRIHANVGAYVCVGFSEILMWR